MSDPLAFEQELNDLINRHSKENGSNTPDYILAAYLAALLVAFDLAVNERERSRSLPEFATEINNSEWAWLVENAKGGYLPSDEFERAVLALNARREKLEDINSKLTYENGNRLRLIQELEAKLALVKGK